MTEIERIIIRRDKISAEEAADRLQAAKDEFYETMRDPEEIVLDHFGLEPDYIFDIID